MTINVAEDTRKLTIDLFDKIFNNSTQSKEVENGIYEFCKSYCYSIDESLHENIYINKRDNLIDELTPDNVGNNDLINRIKEIDFDLRQLAYMKPEELFPKNWEKELKRKNLTEEKKNKRETTNLYKCYQCGARECSVYSQQTRSADEPMTHFINCFNCGNVWKK